MPSTHPGTRPQQAAVYQVARGLALWFPRGLRAREAPAWEKSGIMSDMERFPYPWARSIVYHALADEKDYEELGGNYFDEWDRQAVQKRLVRREDMLGYEVMLTPTGSMARKNCPPLNRSSLIWGPIVT